MTSWIVAGVMVLPVLIIIACAIVAGKKTPRQPGDNLGDRERWPRWEDGAPGGSRRRVWTDIERAQYRRDHPE